MFLALSARGPRKMRVDVREVIYVVIDPSPSCESPTVDK